MSKYIERLKAKLEKDWGKRCKHYDAGCHICAVWHAYDILDTSYDLRDAIHHQQWMENKSAPTPPQDTRKKDK